MRRFRNEAQSAARLDHPNIARVYYVGEDKGWNYIVFEYIEGVNVRDLVEHNGPLSLEDAIRYTLQMAEALEHASQRDVIHRDIKPSNILIMLDGRAKLVDMGLARLHQVESPSEDLTASGVTLGHVRLHLARTSARSAQRRRAQRSVLARLHALLHAHRPTAVSRRHGAAEAAQPQQRGAAGCAEVSAGVAGGHCGRDQEAAGQASPSSVFRHRAS